MIRKENKDRIKSLNENAIQVCRKLFEEKRKRKGEREKIELHTHKVRRDISYTPYS